MNTILSILFIYLIVINMLEFIIYGFDKVRAKKNKWRVKEKNLLLLSIIGGCYGAIFGMNIFRHKNKKNKFIVINYTIFLLWTAILIFIILKL